MTAMMLLRLGQKIARIRIASRADHVMHRTSELIKAVPIQRIPRDRRHRPQKREARPHPVAKVQMRSMQRPAFAGIEPL